MLVLSRKKNEAIVINGDIIVTVIEIRGDKVRIGVQAPQAVPVNRQEIHDAIHRKPDTEEDLKRKEKIAALKQQLAELTKGTP